MLGIILAKGERLEGSPFSIPAFAEVRRGGGRGNQKRCMYLAKEEKLHIAMIVMTLPTTY